MHIGVFSDSINIPPKEGVNVHTYEAIHALLSHDTKPRVTLFVCDRGWLKRDVLRNEPFDTVLVPEHIFYNAQEVTKLIETHNIDIAQTYMTYFGAVVLGPACFDSSIPMVAEFHDLEQDVVSNYFQEGELEEAIVDHVKFQRQEGDYASLVRVMSRYDHAHIADSWDNFDEDKFIWLPVSVKRPADVEFNTSANAVVYVGNMSYAPNAEGAKIITDLISPASPDVHFSLIGRGSELYQGPNIVSQGMVDDLEPYIKEAALGIAPIISGSGMKIKNLTYLKYGVPVLTTGFGAHGYPPTDAIIIEDDFSKWPAIIEELLADATERERLHKVALEYFDQYFNSDNVTEKLVAVYAKAISEYSQNRIVSHPVEDVDMRHVYWLRELRESTSNAVRDIEIIQGANRPIHIVIEGLPGAGKTTLAEYIAKEYDFTKVDELLVKIPDSEEEDAYIHHDVSKTSLARQSLKSVMDRTYLSTLAFNYANDRVSNAHNFERIQQRINEFIELGQLEIPKYLIHLTVPIDVSLGRQNESNAAFWRDRRMLELTAEFNKHYIEKLPKENVLTIDATLPQSEVFKIVDDYLRVIQVNS